MKKFKKLLALALAICMVCSVSVTAFATETKNYVNEDQDKNYSEPMSDQEAVQLISIKKGISLTDATNIYLFKTNLNQRYGDISPYGYVTQEWYHVEDLGAGYEVEVGALIRMAESSGHTGFDTVIESWSVAAGSGNYTWSPSYALAEIISSNKLRLKTSGYLEVEVNSSLGGSMGAELLGAGFEVSSSSGWTTYYRKRVSVDKTITKAL